MAKVELRVNPKRAELIELFVHAAWNTRHERNPIKEPCFGRVF